MNKILIIVGPSGVGKSTLIARALNEFKELEDTTTYTTRNMREGESEGCPYHFVDHKKFEELITQDFFVEWAKVHTNLYGTPMQQLKEAWAKDHVVIMDVDIQGAQSFKKRFKEAVAVFILPPSIDELKKRIIKRDKGEPKDIGVRMENAVKEIAQAPLCDHQIRNVDIDQAYDELKKIIVELVKAR